MNLLELIPIPAVFKAHLPVLQIMVPLVVATLIVLFKNISFLSHRVLAWFLTFVSSLFCLYGSLAMLAQVTTADKPTTLIYQLGNWAPEFGIVYKVDVANSYIITVVCVVCSIIFLYAKESVENEIPVDKHHYFYSMLLMCYTGLMGIAITGDAFNVFVFLEISSLSGYALIAMGKNPRALTAAYRYLVMGTIGGTFILLGIGFIYMATGTLNMDLIHRALTPELAHERIVRAAFAFITVGVSIKLALFPLHMWLPNCYTYAPSVVSAFLSSTATKISFYVLLRAMFTLFGVALATQAGLLKIVVIPLALMAIFVGSINAITQKDVKRLLAYSSVAQIGYMVLGLGLDNQNGLTGGIIHLFNHALMKGGLFLIVGCIFYRIGSTYIDDMRGLGQRMPLTMFAFALGGLGLIGVPFTAGFVSKWYLVLGAFDAGMWWLAVLVLIASLLAVAYVFKVIETAYFQPPPENTEPEEAPMSLLIPSYILILASIYFGIWTDPMLSVAQKAAAMFLGGVS